MISAIKLKLADITLYGKRLLQELKLHILNILWIIIYIVIKFVWKENTIFLFENKITVYNAYNILKVI